MMFADRLKQSMKNKNLKQIEMVLLAYILDDNSQPVQNPEL